MKYGDRIQVTTTGTGTGDLTLGSATDTFRSYTNLVGRGLIPVTIVHQDRTLNEFETVLCSIASTTLTRVKVIASSNSNNLVNFSAGTKYVFVDYIAEVNYPGTQLLKEPVAVVSTSHVTLANQYAGVTLANKVLAENDRVLFAGQSTEADNGIYVIQAATSAPVRAKDAYTGDNIGHALIPVTKPNDVYNSTIYYCNRVTSIIGTDNLTFVPFITSNSTSSTDNAIPRFDGTSGHRLQSSNVTISDNDKLKIFSSYSALYTVSNNGTITLNLNTDNINLVELTGNTTLALSNVTVGQRFAIRIKQDATGGRTLTWFAGIEWPSDSPPTPTTTANKYDWFGFICTSTGEYGAGTFDGFVLGQNYG